MSTSTYSGLDFINLLKLYPLQSRFIVALCRGLSSVTSANCLIIFLLLILLCCHQIFTYRTLSINLTQATKANVVISHDVDGTNVEIGGYHHQQDWNAQLRESYADAFRTRVWSNSNHFKVHFIIYLEPSFSAFHRLQELLAILTLFDSGRSNGQGSVPLKLIIDIRANNLALTDEVMERIELNIDGLEYLQKLTWIGPFANLLFARRMSPRKPWGAISSSTSSELPNNFGRLTSLRLLQCELEPQSLLHILSLCPVLSSCKIHHLVPSQRNTAAGENFNVDSTDGVLHHMHLQHLDLSSTVGLHEFFHKIKFHNLNMLSLRLAPSLAGIKQQYDIPWLNIPWLTLTSFELKAQLDYASIALLKLFLAREPSRWGRKHTLIDDI